MNSDAIEYLAPEQLGGLNLYAYCNNNPVMHLDHNGKFPWVIAIILAVTTIAGIAIGVALECTDDDIITGEKTVAEEVKDVVVTGFVAGSLGLAVGGAIVSGGAVFAGAASIITGTLSTTVFCGVAIPKAFAIGALAFDFFAWFVAPLLGVEMDGIEFPEKPQ